MSEVRFKYFARWEALSHQAWPRLAEARALMKRVSLDEYVDEHEVAAFKDTMAWSSTFTAELKSAIDEASDHPSPDARLVVQFGAKLMNRMAFLAYAELIFSECQKDLNSAVFRDEAKALDIGSVNTDNFYSRISGSLEMTIDGLRVGVDEQLAPLVHANETDSHRLLDRIMLLSVIIVSTGRGVSLDFRWNAGLGAVMIDNDDEHVISVVKKYREMTGGQHTVLRSIPHFAQRIGPPAMRHQFAERFIDGATMCIPLQLAARRFPPR